MHLGGNSLWLPLKSVSPHCALPLVRSFSLDEYKYLHRNSFYGFIAIQCDTRLYIFHFASIFLLLIQALQAQIIFPHAFDEIYPFRGTQREYRVSQKFFPLLYKTVM